MSDNAMPNITTLADADKIDAAAVQLLTGAESISTYKLEIAKLRKSGILVKVTVTGGSLCTRRATFGELGIADADIRRSRYTPGSKFFIPREIAGKWRSIENRARTAVFQYAIPLPGFGDWMWLPYTAIPNLRARITDLQTEATTLLDEITTNYTDWVADFETDIRSSARAAWRAITAQGFIGIKISGRDFYDEWDFEQELTQRALNRLPSITDFQTRMRVVYQAAQVYGLEDAARDQAAAAKIEEEERTIRAAYQEQRARDAIATQAQRDQLQHQRRLQDIEEDQRNAAAQAVIQAELERAKNEIAITGSYVDVIFQTVRDRIAAGAQEMLESIRKNGFLKGKVAERGQGLLELYNTLGGCIHNDRALEATLQQLKSEIGAVGDSRAKGTPARDPNAIRTTLEQIVNLAESELADLTSVNRAEFIEF